MTLDEAIRHCMEKSKELRGEMIDCAEIHDYENAEICRNCADEHDQLGAWLTELKQRREREVNRAEILRLCNDIEDCISEAWALFKIETCDYDLIHEKLQAIGKELNGDEAKRTD